MKKTKTLIILAAAFVLLMVAAVFLYGFFSAEEENLEQSITSEEPGGEEKNPAPDFTVYDQAGNAVQLSDYFGKPIVLNFWASWCGPCRDEMPAFDDAYADLSEDIQFLMVNMTFGRESLNRAVDFVEGQGFSFPVYYDTESDAAATYGVSSFPTTVFIDAEGNVAGQVIGALNRAALQQGIDLMLLE